MAHFVWAIVFKILLPQICQAGGKIVIKFIGHTKLGSHSGKAIIAPCAGAGQRDEALYVSFRAPTGIITYRRAYPNTRAQTKTHSACIIDKSLFEP